MENKNKKIYVIFSIVIVVLIVVLLFYFEIIPSGFLKNLPLLKKGPRVIEENLVIPDTQKINGTEARIVEKGNVETPLVPKNEGEKVIVAKAVLTVKGGYDKALVEAKNWANDAKLVFVKSLGAVTLEGKSSQWQLAFSSATKKGKGYEVIIQADQIVSKKEIESTAKGANLPANWRDSDKVIQSLQELPQFSDATISSISLYYNTDGKMWRYALSTSRGTTSASAVE